MPKNVFNEYSKYYNLFYEDKNYSDEVNYIVNLLNNFGLTNSNILEFGSGTGKHGNLLVKSGYKVHGIEISEEMVKMADQSNGFSCEIGDICSLKLKEKFEVVLSLFHVFSYQTTNLNVKSVFENAAFHLKENGYFIFDAWYSPAVYFHRPTIRKKKVENKNFELVRIGQPSINVNKNIVNVKYTISKIDKNNRSTEKIIENHSMRHFSLPELKYYGNEFGFDHVKSEEFLTGDIPSENTWTICNVFKKKK